MKAGILVLAMALTGCATSRDGQIMGAAVGAAIGTAIASPDTAMLGAVLGAAVGTKLGAQQDHAHYAGNPYQVCDRYWHRERRNQCIYDIRNSQGR